MKSSRRTTLRKLVDEGLAAQKTSLAVLAGTALERGDSYEDITYELRRLTGIPLSSRTIRRWLDNGQRSQSEGAA